ncbi:hypothetical protein B597_008665 [Stutzerimonas stutzeri KOS6]|uniref:Uncharacterized protein n=1 Tax=Stutzerimonas stutzeri KOS6 TaxID=1218352 RepID=A0A061JTW0_STUST|nr:hypothetical protein B597_008665 [Stutzerimonas stutzeri KOS6]
MPGTADEYRVNGASFMMRTRRAPGADKLSQAVSNGAQSAAKAGKQAVIMRLARQIQSLD